MQKVIYIPIDTLIDNTVECTRLVKRGDTLTLQIKVFSNGALANLTGQSIDLILKKADGTLIEKTITSVANGIITASLDVQATNVTGVVNGEVQIYDANGQSSTNTFTFVVDTSLADDVLAKSKDSIETLTQLKSTITDGNTAIQKYKDNVIQIAGTATAVEALAGTKLYIDTNLEDLQSENAKAVTNIATGKTQNDKATQNIADLTSLNLSADTLNIDLESNIAIGTILNDDIESNITTGNTLKTGLETKITDGTTLKTNLDASISTGNTLKTDLGIANIQAEENITAMEGFGDVTVLTQDVTNIKTEMQNARNGEANLDTRLDKMDTSIAKNTTDLSDMGKDQIYYCGATSGTNTYTVTNSKITAYADGLTVRIKIGTASTGASTLNINGLGVKTILDTLGNAITSGGLKAGLPYQLCYNGTNFIVLGKGGGGNVTADKMLNGVTATGDSGSVVGNIPSKATATYNPSTAVQTIASGQYLSGVQTISAITGTATVAQVLAGYTFNSASGIAQTGTATVTSLGGKIFATNTATSTASAVNYTYVSGGSIALRQVTVSGLSFTPTFIYLIGTSGSVSITIYDGTTIRVSNGWNTALSTSANLYSLSPVGVTSGGFTLPVAYSSASYTWFAWS